MPKPRSWTTSIFNRWSSLSSRGTQHPSQQEEQDQILKRAEQFERLEAEPGWAIILQHMVSDVNNAIIEAGNSPIDNPFLKQVHVTRWDAKRQLVDSVQNYIGETMRLKEEILKDRREAEGES